MKQWRHMVFCRRLRNINLPLIDICASFRSEDEPRASSLTKTEIQLNAPKQTNRRNRLKRLMSLRCVFLACCWYYLHSVTLIRCLPQAGVNTLKPREGKRLLGKQRELRLQCEGQTRPIQLIQLDNNWQSDEWTYPGGSKAAKDARWYLHLKHILICITCRSI